MAGDLLLAPPDVGIQRLGHGRVVSAGPSVAGPFPAPFPGPLLSLETISGRLADWRNFETWQEAGAETATQRATAIWKSLLEAYGQPPLDPAVAEALDAYVRRRKEEIARQAA